MLPIEIERVQRAIFRVGQAKSRELSGRLPGLVTTTMLHRCAQGNDDVPSLWLVLAALWS